MACTQPDLCGETLATGCTDMPVFLDNPLMKMEVALPQFEYDGDSAYGRTAGRYLIEARGARSFDGKCVKRLAGSGTFGWYSGGLRYIAILIYHNLYHHSALFTKVVI
jgi:hypothetical protein